MELDGNELPVPAPELAPQTEPPHPPHQALSTEMSSTAGTRCIGCGICRVSVMIAIVVILFLYQPVKVEGTSMMPSLIDQERIFINKFVYKFGLADIGRGDTVVFWYPGDTE